jgi:hypothetical protein
VIENVNQPEKEVDEYLPGKYACKRKIRERRFISDVQLAELFYQIELESKSVIASTDPS